MKNASKKSAPQSQEERDRAHYQTLCTVPSNDENFKASLEDAGSEALNEALEYRALSGSKTAYNAIRAEIRRRLDEAGMDTEVPTLAERMAQMKQDDDAILIQRQRIASGKVPAAYVADCEEVANRLLSTESLAKRKADLCGETTQTALSVVPAEPTDAQMGAQLTEQYHRATEGMRAVVRFGAMMLQLRQELATVSTRGQVSGGKDSTRGAFSSGGPGRGKKGGLSEWLRTFAPDVPEATAYRFMQVAESVQDSFNALSAAALNKAGGFAAFVTADPALLPEKLAAKQLELWSFVDGTSQRSWLDKLRPHKLQGGKRERDPNKEAPNPNDPSVMASNIWAPLLRQLAEEGLTERSWMHLPKAELEHLDGLLLDIRKAIKGEK